MLELLSYRALKNCFRTNRSAFPVVSTGMRAEGKTRGLAQKQLGDWKCDLKTDNCNLQKPGNGGVEPTMYGTCQGWVRGDSGHTAEIWGPVASLAGGHKLAKGGT